MVKGRPIFRSCSACNKNEPSCPHTVFPLSVFRRAHPSWVRYVELNLYSSAEHDINLNVFFICGIRHKEAVNRLSVNRHGGDAFADMIRILYVDVIGHTTADPLDLEPV